MARIYYTFLAGGFVIWPLLGLFVTSLGCALPLVFLNFYEFALA